MSGGRVETIEHEAWSVERKDVRDDSSELAGTVGERE
jgi:hypothetical protein